MKNKLFQKTTLFSLGKIIIASVIIIAAFLFIFKVNSEIKTEALEIKSVASIIQADGAITAQSQATLHFQTGGKLAYLPFREGDKVYQGQTIASLDTYALQRQLTAALNTYRSIRDTFDQTQENTQTGVLRGQQKYSLEITNKMGTGGQAEEDIINNIAKRILDQNQATLDNSVIQVELSNYALALATVTSPISGVITHMDVATPLVNVTPATAFTVADPSSLVFRANVSENDIDFISVGNAVTVRLGSGNGKSISGTVSKIYPDKVTLSTGQKAYLVDIESKNIDQFTVMGQSGTALIQSNSKNNVKLVPTWTVLNHDSVWVLAGGSPVLRQVTVGKTHADMTEILSGLETKDRIITNPESIAAGKYKIL
jgi:membrane fusion protein, multidrug efflux system